MTSSYLISSLLYILSISTPDISPSLHTILTVYGDSPCTSQLPNSVARMADSGHLQLIVIVGFIACDIYEMHLPHPFYSEDKVLYYKLAETRHTKLMFTYSISRGSHNL